MTLLTMSSWTCLLVEHAAKPRGKQTILPWPIKAPSALQVFAKTPEAQSDLLLPSSPH